MTSPNAEYVHYQELLVKVYTAFEMMPALHGAIPATVEDVRAEVNEALDSFMDELVEAMPVITRDTMPCMCLPDDHRSDCRWWDVERDTTND